MNHNKINKQCKLKLRYFQQKNKKISSNSGQAEKKNLAAFAVQILNLIKLQLKKDFLNQKNWSKDMA